MNRYTGERLTDETTHIKQSISDILLTPIGTRIQRREYGSRIPELIDRPINSVLLLQLAACAVMALNRWEPRVQISQFKPQLTPNGICCMVKARHKRNQQALQFDDLLLGGKA